MIRKTLRKFISLTMALVMIFSSSLVYAPIFGHGWYPDSEAEDDTYTIVDGQNVLPKIMEDVLSDYDYDELEVSILLKDQNTILEGLQIKMFDVTTAGAIWIEITGEPVVGSIRTIEINSTNGLSPRTEPYELVAIIKCADHELSLGCFDIEFAWHPLETIYLQVLENTAPVILGEKEVMIDEDAGLTNIVLNTGPTDSDVLNDVIHDDDDDQLDIVAARIREETAGGENVGSISFRGVRIEYTPAPNYNGTFEIVYDIEDEHDARATGGTLPNGGGKIIVTVEAKDDPPTAEDDYVEIAENEIVLINVLENDEDIDGDALEVMSYTDPLYGTVTEDSGVFTYTPDTDYFGEDSFTYKIFEGVEAKVTIYIGSNSPPIILMNKIFSINEDAGLANIKLGNLIVTDPDGDDINITAARIRKATADGEDVGSISFLGVNIAYIPAPNYHGYFEIVYDIADEHGAVAEAGIVEVTVTPVDDPIILNNDVLVTNEWDSFDNPQSDTINVLLNDIVVDGVKSVTFTDPAHGWIDYPIDGNDGRFFYVPHDDYVGPDFVYYTVTDMNDNQATATVSITVTPTYIDIRRLRYDKIYVKEGQTAYKDLLKNDYFWDEVVNVDLYEAPEHGTVTIDVKGNASYTAGPTFNGRDYFEYRVTTSSGDMGVAGVCVYIFKEDNLLLNNDDRTVYEDSTMFDLENYLMVLDNDMIDEGIDEMGIWGTWNEDFYGPFHGSVEVSYFGTIRYIPDPNFNGVDQFQYYVRDNDWYFDVATVEVLVLPVEDPILILEDFHIDIDVNNKASVNVIDDADLSLNPDIMDLEEIASITVTEPVAIGTGDVGTVSVQNSGLVEYTPLPNTTTPVTMEYEVTDIYGDKGHGWITVNVELYENKALILFMNTDDIFVQQYVSIDAIREGVLYFPSIGATVTEEGKSERINILYGYYDEGTLGDPEYPNPVTDFWGDFYVHYLMSDSNNKTAEEGFRKVTVNFKPLVSLEPIVEALYYDELGVLQGGRTASGHPLDPNTVPAEILYLQEGFNILDYLYMYDFETFNDYFDVQVEDKDTTGMTLFFVIEVDEEVYSEEYPISAFWDMLIVPEGVQEKEFSIRFKAYDEDGGESELSAPLPLTIVVENNPPTIDVPQGDYMGQGVDYITTGTTYNPWIGLLDNATDDVTYFDVEDDADIGQPFQEPQVTVKIWDGDEFVVQDEGAFHWDTNIAGLYELTYLVTDFHGLTADGVRYIEVNTIPYVDLMVDVENPNPYIVQVDDEFLTWHNIDFGDADNDPITLSYMIEEFDYGTSSFSTVENVVLPVDELPDAITFDTSEPGLFYVEFGIEDFWEEIDVINRHAETDESRILYVNAPPEIVKADNPILLTFGDEFDPLDYVTATDLEDDFYDIDLVIEYDAEEIDEPGKYMVDFTVYDSMGGMDEITLEVWFVSNPVITVIPDYIMLEVNTTLTVLDGVTAVDWLGESVEVEAYLDLEEDPITQVSSEIPETITVYYTAKTVIDEQEWSAEVKSRDYEVYEKTVTAIPKTVSLHFGYGYSSTASVDLDATQYPEFAFTTPGAFTWTEESPYISVDSETGLVTVITNVVSGTVVATVEVEADGIVDDVVITITKHNAPTPSTDNGSSSSSSSGSSSGSSRPTPRKVVLDTDAVTLDYGEDADPAFTSYDFKETVTGTADKRVTWSLDDDTFVTVDSNGVVTAIDDIPVGQGDITVTLTVTMVDGGRTDTATILFLENNPLGAIEFYQPYIVGYPDGSFRPLNSITRAEAATMFTNMLRLNMEYPGTRAFNDVAQEHWAYNHIQAIIRTGIFVGYEDGSFKPEDPITRAEMAQLFSNYWKFAEIDVNGVQPAEIPDVPVTHWAADAINKMYNTGLFTGYDDGSYKPELPTLRKDVVVMINKLLGRPANPAAASKFTDILTTHPNFGDIEAASQVYVKPQLQE